MTDEELLTEYLKTKDRELFTILHERMRDRLYALALHMIHLPDDAEDIVQTVFCKLCKARSQEIRSAEGFLKTMTKRSSGSSAQGTQRRAGGDDLVGCLCWRASMEGEEFR